MRFRNRYLWTYIAGALTLMGGLVAGFRLLRPHEFFPSLLPIRQSAFQASEYRFINPLLALNRPESLGFVRLRQLVHSAIDSAVAEKKIRTASVYFQDLNNSEWVGANIEETYNPASMMKVVTMIAAFKRAEVEPAVLKATLRYDGSFDSNLKEHLRSPTALQPGEHSVESLIRMMIEHSDNNAAALLNDHLNQTDLSLLEQPYLDLGINSVDVTDDYISVRRYSLVWRVLYNSSYLSRPMSEMALDILTGSDFVDGIIKGVPPTMVVAHKYGEFGLMDESGNVLKAELHECGIVYDGEHPYLLCVMTKGDDLHECAALIAQMSAIAYGSEERRARAW